MPMICDESRVGCVRIIHHLSTYEYATAYAYVLGRFRTWQTVNIVEPSIVAAQPCIEITESQDAMYWPIYDKTMCNRIMPYDVFLWSNIDEPR